ncbi:MAG: amidase [Gammaproteobacteria bacterium]|nr:amidase [Gammaproteobacteria bacterium]
MAALDDPASLTANAAAAAIRDGALSSEELTRACLARIEAREAEVAAWAHLDPEHALAQARRLDELRAGGAPLGALHGLPVGIKDIFDTRDYPTEDGTELHAGRTPDEDASAVALLRAAGALVMGKTVTTELAAYAPGKTRNPHDPARTPGGSSSGSAAAVAAGMVPLALGSQTNGSVIRPAAYCGVVGYKPTFGTISRHRVLQQSRHLDHVGVFARTVEDAALMAECLMAHDEHDPDTSPRARPALLATAREEPPVTPHLAFVESPQWEHADADTREGFVELVEHLGDRIEPHALPEAFAGVIEWHRTVMEGDFARSFAREYATGRERLSSVIREQIERGRGVLAMDYNEAVARQAVLNALLEDTWQRFDAIVAPAATGEAPAGLDATGSPVFCTTWTFCGTPAVTLPLLTGSHGLPIGVQVVGRRGDDARLLRTARWLAGAVAQAALEDSED